MLLIPCSATKPRIFLFPNHVSYCNPYQTNKPNRTVSEYITLCSFMIRIELFSEKYGYCPVG